MTILSFTADTLHNSFRTAELVKSVIETISSASPPAAATAW